MSSGTTKSSWRLWVMATAALLLLNGPTEVHSARILAFVHLFARSHFIVFEALFKELAARGHQVDVVSHYPQQKQLPNYRDISLVGTFPDFEMTFEDFKNLNFFSLMYMHWNFNFEVCKKAMEHPFLKNLAKNPEPYDLVFVEVFGSDCAYGFAHKIGAPVIGLTSLKGLPYGQERIGNPDNPAYIPVANLPFTSHMNLWERTLNTLGQQYAVWGERFNSRMPTDQLLRETFGEDIPPLDELVRNTTMVMVNSHFSLHGARPAVPGYLEVGGMHVNPKRGELPKNMQDFLDGAGPEGAVVVSFGSLVPAHTMPQQQLQAFMKVLGSLPHRVVWSIDSTKVPGGLPPNVLGSAWIPQQALLSHPKMRAFVAHGGLGGTWESVHWGVPMVVVPLFTDQRQDGMLLEQNGAARVLQFDDITEATLRAALHAVLYEPSYRENMMKLRQLLHDSPMTSMETAVWWTEYVIRHRGAPHLCSAAVDLEWYQLLLLDVAAVLLGAAALLAAVVWLVVRITLRCLCSGSKKVETKMKAKIN